MQRNLYVSAHVHDAQRTCTFASCNLQRTTLPLPPFTPVGMKRGRDPGATRASIPENSAFTATQLSSHAATAYRGGDIDHYGESFSPHDTLSSSPPPDLRSPARCATSDYRYLSVSKTLFAVLSVQLLTYHDSCSQRGACYCGRPSLHSAARCQSGENDYTNLAAAMMSLFL